MGVRASHTAEVILEDCRIPEDNLLGSDEGTAFYGAMKTLESSRPLVASGAIGIARAAYEYALDYSRKRKAFGTPIAKKQAIAFMLAADMAMDVTTDAVQILGGAGYMKDEPVEKWMRDAKIFQIWEGTSQIQRLVISREEIGDLVHPFLHLDELRHGLRVRLHAEPDPTERLQGLLDPGRGVRRGHPLAVGEVEDLRGRSIIRLDEMIHPFLASDLHEARIAHLADVVVDRLRREVELRRDLAHGHLLRSQQVDHAPSGLVPEQLERLRVSDHLERLHGRLGTMNICLCL